MSWNTFGRMLRFTTWGESHGSAIGVVVDGVPPGIPLDTALVQRNMDKRKPGSSRFVTQRRESDEVEFLSGYYAAGDDQAALTTGTALSMLIRNTDQRSRDYSDIAQLFRPGHADYTYTRKYGVRDPRGGGRSSARETAARVAAGSIAEIILGRLAPAIKVRCAVIAIGGQPINEENWDWDEVERNPFGAPDAAVVEPWSASLDQARKAGDSLGAVLHVQADNVPAGLGAPIYAKLDADIAAALMGINAVKAVEIGDGFAAASNKGTANADAMYAADKTGETAGEPHFGSNHAGGILGGISSGQPIVARFAVKPTSSVRTPQATVDTSGKQQTVSTRGRHDPCVGIRAAPIARAMMNFVIADHFLLHRAQCG